MYEFHVNSFVGVVHVGISESHVLNSFAANRSNGQAYPACSNSLKCDVAAVAFDAEGVVLVPDITIVYPDIVAGHVKAISVESAHIIEVVVVFLIASVDNRAESNLHISTKFGFESPVWRIVEVEVFNQSVMGEEHCHKFRAILLPDQVADEGNSPPDLSVPFHCASARTC